jgi:hypothetical protein
MHEKASLYDSILHEKASSQAAILHEKASLVPKLPNFTE